MKKRIQALALVSLTAAIIFFALQNLHTVPVAFLVWDFEANVSLLVLIPLLAGLLIGAGTAVYIAALSRVKARRELAGAATPEEPALQAPADEAAAGMPDFKDQEEIGA